MIFGLIVMSAIGILLIVLGLVLWLKQKITLVHSYHYGHVKEKDIAGYTKTMGIGLIIMGAGSLITGIVLPFKPGLCFIFFGIGLVAGIVFLIKAQTKYNRP